MKAALEARHLPMVRPLQAFGIQLFTQISSTELSLQMDAPIAPNVWKGQCLSLNSTTLFLLAFLLYS